MLKNEFVTRLNQIFLIFQENKDSYKIFCEMFPNFISAVYFSHCCEIADITSQEIDDGHSPETCNQLLIANDYFREVIPILEMKRRHGRYGFQYAHVMEFSQQQDPICLAFLDRLSYISHPNLLQCFYLTEISSKT